MKKTEYAMILARRIENMNIHNFEVDGVLQLYKEVLNAMTTVTPVAPNNKKTREIPYAYIRIRNPKQRCFYNQESEFNIADAVKSSCCMFAPYKMSRNNINDKHCVPGEFDTRIAFQLSKIISRFKNDLSTRQAVIPIIQPSDIREGRCTQCIMVISFLYRDNKLNCMVNQRSCDFINEGTYDLFNFVFLHEVLSNELGWKQGELYWQVNSLHVYDEDWNKFDINKSEEVSFATLYTIKDAFLESKTILDMINDGNAFSEPASILKDIIVYDMFKKQGINIQQMEFPAHIGFARRWFL